MFLFLFFALSKCCAFVCQETLMLMTSVLYPKRTLAVSFQSLYAFGVQMPGILFRSSDLVPAK